MPLVHLSYSAPDSCPPEAQLVAAVESRGGHFDGPEAPARVRDVTVSIERDADGFRGALRVETSDGASTPREVHAADCAKVVEGLAVVAAIALRAPPPDPPPTRLTGSTFRREEAVNVTEGTLHFDRARTYEISAGAELGPLPVLMPRYGFSSSVAHFVTPPEQSSFLVGPIIDVHWSVLGPTTYQADAFTVRAWGLEAGVSACSAITYDTGGFTLRTCGEFGVGLMSLSTRSAGVAAQTKEMGFGTAGLAIDASYNIGSHFFLGLNAGGRMQLGRVTAERTDGSQIFESSLFGGYAQAGVGLHFP
jgi:hypothetical protein